MLALGLERRANPPRSGAFDLWILEVEVFQGFERRTRHDQPSEPFVVSGHNVPGRFPAAGGADRGLIGIHVFVPELALSDVIHGELPLLGGLVEPGQETPALLLLRDMQEEFEYDDTVVGKMSLKGANILETLLPYVLAN